MSLALGLLHAWVGRQAMNPDGVSYLDVGDAFFRHDWRVAINGWWSPLYPWALGVFLGIARPSPHHEFLLVHVFNFAVFTAALLAFRFLMHGFLQFIRGEGIVALPEWGLTLLGYAIFLWISLEVVTVYAVGADLAVVACYCLSLGILLRLHPDDGVSKFALFGLSLGIGYWTKSILLPLGFAALLIGYLWKRGSKRWRNGIALAGVVFIASAAPLVLLLSHQKGRLTFGDSGRVNYAWAVSPRTPTRNWQGAEPGSGIPVHPTRQLMRHPPVFEFNGPLMGTYPPWTDPSYWNEGLQWHFSMRGEFGVLATTIPSELRLVFRDRPELFTAIIILGLMAGKSWLPGLSQLWPFIILPILGMGIYVPVIENDRYLAGFVLILFVAIFASIRLRPEVRKIAGYAAVAVFVSMIFATADYTVRIVTHHLAIPGNGPNSTVTDLILADRLKDMGTGPGSKVAIIGDGTSAYWARLGRLRIVSEIMDTNHGSTEFWNSSEEVQQQVYNAFRQAHAQLVVSTCPICPGGTPSGWEGIAGTPYCVRRLD